MVLVVDFDGTLVRENSSRVLESLLIRHSKFWGPFLVGLGKLIGYEGDFRRYVILNLSVKKYGPEKLKEAMKKTAEKLTVREEFKNREFIVLSSGLLPVIMLTIKLNNLNASKVYASKLSVVDNRITIRELTTKNKARILKELSDKYGNVVYYTDDKNELVRLKCERIKVIIIK